jgi:hypothetical protein
MRSLVSLSTVLLVLGLSGASLAQPRTEPRRDPLAAEALFREARKSADQRDFASACPKFEESQRLDPAAGTLLNLADCEEHINKIASAWLHYQQATDMLGSGDERIELARQRIADLEKKLPKLVLKLTAQAPRGTRVYRDGIEVGSASFGVALPMNPGTHDIVVMAPGHPRKAYPAVLAVGQVLELELDPGVTAPEEPKTPSPTAPPDTPSISNQTLGLVFGGAGVLGVAVGTVTGALAIGRRNEMREHCNDQMACDQTGVDAADSGKTYSTISTASFALGVLGLGAGAYFILTGDEAKAVPTTSVAPLGLAGGGGMSLRRTF